MSQQDLKKSYGWWVKFNLKPLDIWKRIGYGFLYFYSHHPRRDVPFKRKDIEKFINNTKATINHLYNHKFFTTYQPHFQSLINLKIKNWTYDIFLPFPELFQGSTKVKQKYYYYALFHELIHWTGSEYNLKRFSLEHPLGESNLSRATEEVVAGVGSAILLKKFDLYDSEMEERVLLYINEYAMLVAQELYRLKLITLRPQWGFDDYLKNEPLFHRYILNLYKRADNAVQYLESLQK